MRALDPEFQAHLAAGATTLATCWRIERADGVVLGFTDHDRPLEFDGVRYGPETGATGAALAASADLAADNSEIEGALSADALSAGDLAAGRYDGARVEIWRVNWAAPERRARLKVAVIGEIERAGAAFRAELRGVSALLDRPHGRVFQRGCDVDLGAAPCGVDLGDAAFRGAGVVTALAGTERFLADGLAGFPADWFAHGRLDWTGGANAGAGAWVKTQGAAGDIALWAPPGAAIAIGDAFTVFAGCDKRFETCCEKFANGENFRGFPTMPGNDFAMSYPASGEANDGGRRS